ncbi:MAG: hypothetical protein M3P16_07620 [Chloroflexota bacterium]|nr:hypothetical protein [Chloroflexota bacterium]
MSAVIVSFVATLLVLVTFSGLGFVGYKYAPAVLAGVYLLLLLGVAAVVGFDLTVVIGSRRRWRYLIPTATLCLVIAGVCLFVAGTTPY